MRQALNPARLPPYLQQACTVLAAGLVRLRRHTAEDVARNAADAAGQRESSLHFVAYQRGHAKPRDEELA
jgi:hypothetical protein